jgi:hypothetical protein
MTHVSGEQRRTLCGAFSIGSRKPVLLGLFISEIYTRFPPNPLGRIQLISQHLDCANWIDRAWALDVGRPHLCLCSVSLSLMIHIFNPC